MAIQHGEITNSQHVHECKQILEATANDAGMVITPSSDGRGELRRLRYEELDGLPEEAEVKEIRIVEASSAAQIVVTSDDAYVLVLVTFDGASVLLDEVEDGTVVEVVKMDAGASVEVVLSGERDFFTGTLEEIEDTDPIHTNIKYIAFQSDKVVGY